MRGIGMSKRTATRQRHRATGHRLAQQYNRKPKDRRRDYRR